MREVKTRVGKEEREVNPSMVPASEGFVKFMGSFVSTLRRYPSQSLVISLPDTLSGVELKNARRIATAAGICVRENGGSTWFLSPPPT